MTSDGKEIFLRRAVRDDLPRIVDLLADDMLGATRETVTTPVADCYVRGFEAIEAQAGNEFLVMVREGTVIGCLQLTIIAGLGQRGKTRAQIESVRVDSALRGQGMGTRLFEMAIERARAQGADIVQLTTDLRRTDAQRFYEKLGFKGAHVGMKLVLE